MAVVKLRLRLELFRARAVFLHHHPVDDFADIVVGDGWMRRHRDRAPDAGTAFFNVFDQAGFVRGELFRIGAAVASGTALYAGPTSFLST